LRFELTLGTGLELTREGVLIFRAFIDVGVRGISGSAFHWESGGREAQVGSIEVDRLLEQGLDEVTKKLGEGLQAFVDNLPART
jgi:hypothetical protein